MGGFRAGLLALQTTLHLLKRVKAPRLAIRYTERAIKVMKIAIHRR
jgi:hypothetical protein